MAQRLVPINTINWIILCLLVYLVYLFVYYEASKRLITPPDDDLNEITKFGLVRFKTPALERAIAEFQFQTNASIYNTYPVRYPVDYNKQQREMQLSTKFIDSISNHQNVHFDALFTIQDNFKIDIGNTYGYLGRVHFYQSESLHTGGLSAAVRFENLHAVDTLLRSGNVTGKDEYYDQVFNEAIENNRTEVMELLLKSKRVPLLQANSKFISAIKRGYLEICALFLKDTRVDIAEDNYAALDAALQTGNREIFRLFVTLRNIPVEAFRGTNINRKDLLLDVVKYIQSKRQSGARGRYMQHGWFVAVLFLFAVIYRIRRDRNSKQNPRSVDVEVIPRAKI